MTVDQFNKKIILGAVLSVFVFALSGFSFGNDKTEDSKNKTADSSPAGKANALTAQTQILEKVAEKISSVDKAGQQAEAKQIAKEIKQLEVEKKVLTQASAEGVKNTDPEVVQARLALAEKRKQLMEDKAEFLQDRVRIQNLTHEKIKFLLTNVFSDSASFFVVIEELKRIRGRIWDRVKDKALILSEMESLNSRIQLEKQFLDTKKMLVSVARDQEKSRMEEAVAVAQERMSLLQETKAFLDERLSDVDFRLTALDEFNRLIRLRRAEVFVERVTGKKEFPLSPQEKASALIGFLILTGIVLFRRTIAASNRIQSFFSTSPAVVVACKFLFVLGWGVFAGWGVLSLLGYRGAAVALGLIFLNVALGFSFFALVKGSAESLCVRFLQKIARMTQTEIKDSSPIFLLVRTVLMWIVFVVIFQQILSWWALRQEATQWLSAIANYPIYKSAKITVSLWTLLRSVLVFWFFYLGSQFLNGILKTRVYPKSSLDKNSQYAIHSVIQFTCIVIGALAGIQLFGIDLSVLAVFSGTLGIGIGFGLQEIVKNVFSGFVIFFERPIRMGDIVEVGGSPGVVKSIRTRSTIVNTFDNISIVVPNSEFLTNRVVNWSHSDRTVRMESRVGVDYGSNPEKVRQTLLEIAKASDNIFKQPEPLVVFEEFGDSALNFRLLYWVDVDDRMEVRSEINFAIYDRFKKEGISIPFPQSDVHLKSCDFDLIQKKPAGA